MDLLQKEKCNKVKFSCVHQTGINLILIIKSKLIVIKEQVCYISPNTLDARQISEKKT